MMIQRIYKVENWNKWTHRWEQYIWSGSMFLYKWDKRSFI